MEYITICILLNGYAALPPRILAGMTEVEHGSDFIQL